MASTRRLDVVDAVDVAVREFTRLVRESRSCRDGVVPTQVLSSAWTFLSILMWQKY